MDESEMPEQPDLLELLGELWCLTLAPGSIAEVLGRMGLDPSQELVPLTFVQLVEASESPDATSGPDGGYRVALGARSVTGGQFTLVVQYDGAHDWIGVQEEVLQSLANPGRAATHFFGENVEVWCAENESILFAADAGTWLSWGPQPRLLADLLPARFSDFDDLAEARPQAPETLAYCLKFTPHLIEAFIGCRLNQTDFEGPWQVGWVSR